MKKIIVLGLGLVLLAAACNKQTVQPSQNPPPKEDKTTAVDNRTIELKMSAQNGSKEVGTARLKAEGGETRVNIELGVFPKDIQQPAHIHMGSCATLGGVKYPLTSLVNGRSETLVNVSLADLLNALPLAINVHKSATEVSVYVSCADLTNGQSNNDSSQEKLAQQIVINANGFSPANITVKQGTVVTFVNKDSQAHWPASNPHPVHSDLPGFDALKGLTTGGVYSYTFTKLGTWGFHDHVNPVNHGSVTVVQ